MLNIFNKKYKTDSIKENEIIKIVNSLLSDVDTKIFNSYGTYVLDNDKTLVVLVGNKLSVSNGDSIISNVYKNEFSNHLVELIEERVGTYVKELCTKIDEKELCVMSKSIINE